MTIQDVKIEFQLRLHKLYDTKEIQTIFEILASDISISKADINRNAYKELQAEYIAYFKESLIRLEKNEPVQFLGKKADFYGMEFTVSPAVLIPRQETELLVRTIIEQTNIPNPIIVDLGTGSGCISISLAKGIKNSDVYSVDVSSQALKVAQNNADSLNVKISCIEANILLESHYNRIPQCHILVSNPPYVCENEKIIMHNNILNFEPHLALFVEDSNPLQFYEAIASIGMRKLHDNGIVYCKINEAFGEQTKQLFQKFGYSQVKILKDLHEKDRFIMCKK